MGCLDTFLASFSILHPQTNKNNLNGQMLLTLEHRDQCRTDLVFLYICGRLFINTFFIAACLGLNENSFSGALYLKTLI